VTGQFPKRRETDEQAEARRLAIEDRQRLAGEDYGIQDYDPQARLKRQPTPISNRKNRDISGRGSKEDNNDREN
jgi:hypothetical protein